MANFALLETGSITTEILSVISYTMPEYTYLVETRLSAAQQKALAAVRDAAREAGMVVFLAGGAIRDLTTGSSVRDLDFAVQGNALDLKKALIARGATVWGSHDPSRTLFLWFPGSVRVEVTSTRKESFPKPGKPVYTWSGIIDDLHRRDFTANAMAISLNEGSYGLLLDPLNGVADIEARQLRLVNNYGFLEDPIRLVRAIRLSNRLGWTLEERTQTRYENAKEADNFSVSDTFHRGYELEEIATEESALGVIRALEAEGWMGKLAPEWTSAKADTVALENLHKNRIQLLMQNISPDLTAAHLEILTAKMSKADRDALKARLPRTGLRAQWEGLAGAAQEFGKLLSGPGAAQASAAWKLFHESSAESILWLAHTRKGGAVEQKFKNLFTVWPEVAKQVPVALMLEMRITPELPAYNELLQALFLQQIDGKLSTDELMRAFLEPYSPPAPPPPVTLKRTRSKKSEGRGKKRGSARDEDDDPDRNEDEDLDDAGLDRDDEDSDDLSSDEERDDHEDEDRNASDEDDEDESEKRPAAKPAPAAVKKSTKDSGKVLAAAAPVKTAAPPAPAAVPSAAKHAELAKKAAAPAPAPHKTAEKTAEVKSAPVKAAPVKGSSTTTVHETPKTKVSAPVHAKAAPVPVTAGAKHAAPAKKASAVVAKPAAKAAPASSHAKAATPAKKAAPVKAVPAKKAAVPAKKPAVKKAIVPVKKHAAPAVKKAALKPAAKKAAPAKKIVKKAPAKGKKR